MLWITAVTQVDFVCCNSFWHTFFYPQHWRSYFEKQGDYSLRSSRGDSVTSNVTGWELWNGIPIVCSWERQYHGTFVTYERRTGEAFYPAVQITFTEKSRISDIHSLSIHAASGFICRREMELFCLHVKDFSSKSTLHFFQLKFVALYFLFFG